MKKQIFAMGGGGFLMEPENPLLDNYFFGLTRKPNPKVCFVSTAGGGNTRNLLVLWKEWELDRILRDAYESGIVIGGISAGSICWFEQGVTDSIPGSLTALNCLGFLKGSNCVHYDGEAERRPTYRRLIAEGMKPGFACDDSAAGYFVDGELVEFVSSRPNAKAYRVEKVGDQVRETVLPTRYLGT